MLTHPVLSANAAANGLLLWYKNLLPTLLPMAILSNLLIQTDSISLLTAFLYPVTKHIYPTSQNGTFAFLGGLFFGFPMGSKLSCDLTESGKITAQEGEILSCTCNQLSPMYLLGYVYPVVLKKQCSLPFFIAAIYAPPLLYGFFHLKTLHLPKESSHPSSFNTRKRPTGPFSHSLLENAASSFPFHFKIIDACIINGCETLLKLGCYIMLFSIFASMIQSLCHSWSSLNPILFGILEITTGLHALSSQPYSDFHLLLLVLCLCSFGGLCGLAQSCSFTNLCSFSGKRYFVCRLMFSLATALLVLLRSLTL